MTKKKPTYPGALTEVPMSLRVHKGILDEAARLVPLLEANPKLATKAGGSNRAAVLRLALVEGLELLERRWSRRGTESETSD